MVKIRLSFWEQTIKSHFFYYDWAGYLSSMFTPVPHITSYHHFRCMHTDPGHVFVREFADSEETNIVIIRPNVAISKTALPSTLTPPGLSEERKQYLFQQIRPYCDEKYRDITEGNNDWGCHDAVHHHYTLPYLQTPLLQREPKPKVCKHCFIVFYSSIFAVMFVLYISRHPTRLRYIHFFGG